MPWPAWIAILIVLIVVVVLAVSSIRGRRKQRRQLEQGFGVPGKNHRAFYPAESYWQAYLQQQPAGTHSYVDDLTWANLEMDQIYMHLNTCQSEAGDIRLYKSLRTLDDGAEALQKRARLCDGLAGDAPLRIGLQTILARIGRHNTGTVQMLTLDAGYLTVKYKRLVFLLAVLPIIFFALIFVNSAVGLMLFVLSLLANLLTSYLFKNNTSSYSAVFPLATAVRHSQKLADRMEPIDADLAARIRKSAGALRPFSLPFAVMSFSNAAEVQMLPDFLGVFQLPMLAYFRVVRHLKTYADSIAELYECIGDIDMACAVLSYRASLPLWCRPEFAQEEKLSSLNLYHPMLSEPVANSITMDRSILLTGSNASGKSTFIKTVAINCILAQSVLTCSASSFLLRRGGVVSAMAIQDNIFEGDSYFVAEVKALRRMLRTVEGDFHYLFIDEILRGTNTIERIGASGAFLRYIAGMDCLCIAATHDIELVSIVDERFDLYHFSETVRDKQVSFTYELHKGPVQTRNALLLLEGYEFPQDIVQNARRAVERFEDTGQWT